MWLHIGWILTFVFLFFGGLLIVLLWQTRTRADEESASEIEEWEQEIYKINKPEFEPKKPL